MSKKNYYYDTKKLKFVEATRSPKEKAFRVLGFLALTCVFAFLILIIAYNTIDSPKEKGLKREISQLKLEYNFLNKSLDEMESVLGDLQKRDDNIYRVIFEAEPISKSIREGGFGGTNPYKDLQSYDNAQVMIQTKKRLNKMNKQLYIQSKSYDDVVKMVKAKAKMLASLPAIQPISNKDLARMASGYGYRIHPIYKTRMFHAGMDFTADTGTEIFATGNGKIIRVEKNKGGYGNLVVVDHGYGYQTYYAHLSKFNVRVGQKVLRGDVIGFVGSTGRSTAPHLHYEVRKNGQHVNPIDYYYNDLSPEEYEKMIAISQTTNQSFD